MTVQTPQPSNQTPPPPKEKQEPWQNLLATILLRIAVGGGLGTLVTSLSSSELPKLALGGAIGGGVAPVLLAFTEPISKKSKQLAGQTGQSIVEGAESRFQRWKGNHSDIEQRYQEALQAHCYALECEGFSGLMPRLALQDIFVPLKLTGQTSNPNDGASQIWSFLPLETGPALPPEEKRLAIIAKPGFGKTTLTRHLAYCFSSPSYQTHQVQELMPILIRFRDIYGQIQAEHEPSLEKLAVRVIQGLPAEKEIGITENWLREEKLKLGTCLVMFDGLDEVPEGSVEQPLRELVSQWAHYQMQQFPSVFILTSRPHGYNAALFSTVRPLQILDFNNDQKLSFIEKWYQVERWQNKWDLLFRDSLRKPEADRLTEGQARAKSQSEGEQAAKNLYEQIILNSSINQQLAINPLLLTIIAATHQAFDSLPDRRITLYRKMFGLLLEYRPKQRDTRLAIRDANKNQELLQKLAMKLSQADQTQFQLKDAEKWIGPSLKQVETDTSSYSTSLFLRQIEQIAGLLVGGDSDLYEFAHKTFQEYLVAAEIKQGSALPIQNRLNQPDWQKIDDWKEIFSFYAALTSADFLVDAIKTMPEGHKRQQTILLLKQFVLVEKSTLTPNNRQQLEDWISGLDLSDLETSQVATITLEQRFQQMIEIKQGVCITAEPITWNIYQQCLADQSNGQFHSTAQPQDIQPNQLSKPVENISNTDRNWFCAWLATQTSLQSDDQLYDYRQPNQAGLKNRREFYIVRVTLDSHYQKLINLLASSAWVEADQETDRLMLRIRGKEPNDYLTRTDFQGFPCVDLAHIDQLWVKNSGGRFGFTIQKSIWEACGSPTEYNEAWEKFGDRVGWRAQGKWLDYDSLNPSISSPYGIFPWIFRGVRLGWGRKRIFSSLASRLIDCSR